MSSKMSSKKFCFLSHWKKMELEWRSRPSWLKNGHKMLAIVDKHLPQSRGRIMNKEFWNSNYLYNKYCTIRIQTLNEVRPYDVLTLLPHLFCPLAICFLFNFQIINVLLVKIWTFVSSLQVIIKMKEYNIRQHIKDFSEFILILKWF